MSKLKVAAEALSRGWEIIKRGWRTFRPEPKAPAAHPSHRDAEHIAKASRCAGHEQEPQCYPAKPPKGVH